MLHQQKTHRSIVLLMIFLLALLSLLLLRPLNLISASSHTELDEYNESLDTGRITDGLACARFDLEEGRNALHGAGINGRYEIHEIGTGRILAAWEAEADWIDSGWLYEVDSTFKDGSWVEVVFYPEPSTRDEEPLGVKLEILNPAADTDGYGWLKPGLCHALELQFPAIITYDQPILGDPPLVLTAGSPTKENATIPEVAQAPGIAASSASSAAASSGSSAAGTGSGAGSTAATATATPQTTAAAATATPTAAPTDEATDGTATPAAQETAAPTETPSTEEVEEEIADNWLIYINDFRQAAFLPAVREDETLTEGSVWHSSYMVLNDAPIAHSEAPENPLFDPDGDMAARQGNIFATTQTEGQYNWAINFWFSAPFHSVAMLDPRLQTVGYGDFVADDGTFKMAAVADVRTGVGPVPDSVAYPIFFPGPDSETWITRLSMDEWPNPYGNCPGYSRPSGPALIVQLGTGDVTPRVTNAAFLNDGEHLPVCVFDETNYRNAVPYEQNLGRTILDERDAIVIIPRNQLIVGERYEMYLEVNGEVYDWFFDVVSPPTLPPD